MNDVPCCVFILCADTIWYIVSCARSSHFSASLVEPVSKPSNVGNSGAGAFNWSTNSLRTSFDSLTFIAMISSSGKTVLVEFRGIYRYDYAHICTCVCACVVWK